MAAGHPTGWISFYCRTPEAQINPLWGRWSLTSHHILKDPPIIIRLYLLTTYSKVRGFGTSCNHYNSIKIATILLPFYLWGKWGSLKISNLSKVPKSIKKLALESSSADAKTQTLKHDASTSQTLTYTQVSCVSYLNAYTDAAVLDWGLSICISTGSQVVLLLGVRGQEFE